MKKFRTKKSKQKKDFSILILIPILVSLFLIAVKANFFTSTILLFGTPALYLISKNTKSKGKKIIKKTALFSAIFSIPLTLILDYLISKDNGWHITNTIFSFKLLNIVAIEQFFWSFLWVFYVVMFYEYFLDKKRISLLSFFRPKSIFKNKDMITKRMKQFSLFLLTLLTLFLLINLLNPSLLIINYSYLIFGTVFGAIPAFIFLSHFPNLFTRFFKITIYFIFFALILEYVGLRLNHWTFPGSHFLGKTNFFGFSIPYEEIILYFVLSTPSVLSYYEFFDDDQK